MAAAERDRSAAAGHRLPRAARIRASTELRKLFRRGKRRKTRHLDVFVSASPAVYPRLGLVVPRHRQKVVRRNLLKRRLKEIGRRIVLPRLRAAERPLDVLIRARPEAYGAAFAELEQQLEELVQELCSPGS